eukprot:TRINITY_DN15230_c0_g1_i3.p1 TRINITY_DN15230_c0_g1~~TRINITY_DN15230_c0_g1_i3.p1  ORF type:complete len:451 (+),score=43.55 TRINITY_DN15230_c0_g1_i3:163-1515(+)
MSAAVGDLLTLEVKPTQHGFVVTRQHFYTCSGKLAEGQNPSEETKAALRAFNRSWNTSVVICRLCFAAPEDAVRAEETVLGNAGIIRTDYSSLMIEHLQEVHQLDCRPPPKGMPPGDGRNSISEACVTRFLQVTSAGVDEPNKFVFLTLAGDAFTEIDVSAGPATLSHLVGALSKCEHAEHGQDSFVSVAALGPDGTEIARDMLSSFVISAEARDPDNKFKTLTFTNTSSAVRDISFRHRSYNAGPAQEWCKSLRRQLHLDSGCAVICLVPFGSFAGARGASGWMQALNAHVASSDRYCDDLEFNAHEMNFGELSSKAEAAAVVRRLLSKSQADDSDILEPRAAAAWARQFVCALSGHHGEQSVEASTLAPPLRFFTNRSVSFEPTAIEQRRFWAQSITQCTPLEEQLDTLSVHDDRQWSPVTSAPSDYGVVAVSEEFELAFCILLADED